MFTDNLAAPAKEANPTLSPDALLRLTELLKSVAHPLRISIVQLLADGEPMMVTEIYRSLRIEQAEASRQLGILKRSRILKAKRNGKHIHYQLAEPQVLEMLKCMERCSFV